MTTSSKLLEFLWEPAVAHTAYIQNHTYTTSIKDKTLYQARFGTKPNISHLREFGAPVWILLQGQNITRKILPKSKRRAYVRYDDVSKSVLYYNTETRTILTSRNYVFLTAKSANIPEEITVEDTPMCEGEREEGGMLEADESTSLSCKRKEHNWEDKPHRTRGVCLDYQILNDPYSSEDEEDNGEINEDENENLLAEVLTAKIANEFHSLKEAQASYDWPKWDSAIHSKLNQHQEKGTWELVERLKDARILSNKWVFVAKRDKEGKVAKNKARLVGKGCGQRPGNYLETHSPVVQLESIHNSCHCYCQGFDNPTDGCQRRLSKWNLKGNSVYVPTRRL
jgi:hypothetical protein